MKFMSKEAFDLQRDQEKIDRLLEMLDKPAYSKYKIMKFLMQKGLWEQFKQWIENMHYTDFWSIPLDFEEDDSMFQEGVAAFKLKFEFTDEQLEEMKAACRK